MNYDFSKPQRQSGFGIILMAANTLQHLIRALIFPLIIAFAKLDKQYLAYIGLGLLGLLIILFVYSYFNYRNFTFFLDEQKQEFVINKGIFNKTQLTVQLDKIQQVNINQNLLQKIIGIYGLKVDTAGSEGQEVSIKAIDEEIANSLREHLLSRKSIANNETSTPKTASVQEDIPFLKVSLGTLFKVGLTSNYGSTIALLLAFIYPVFHNAKEFLKAFDMDKGQVENAVESLFTLFSIGILVAVFLFLILAINVIRTLVKYFDFHISKHKHSLLISHGFFAKKNTLLSPNKVQITSYSQNYFQKKMNLLNMNLKQASSGEAKKGKDLESNNLQIPGCNPTERDELIKMIMGEIPAQGKTFLPNWRFLNLPIFFRVVFPVGIFMILWAYIPALKPYYPAAIIYFLMAIPMIFISYKRHRLTVNKEFIVKRSGIWDVNHSLLFPHKIQAITTFQYPWHKGVDVGHVNLHTAAGVIHFKYGNYTEIKKLVNYWLYQIESGSEEWM
ncbi:PH domain-containing protein [Pedobacter sp. LMG 31464]|uniref:PH domain-containing protein n=1 Tax=Pedobacter planticolens TaxID=2679964 RepID=A0A923E0Q1_9SPHI|nr:PH domain-containing protein [Pedobacter planticolens]MBB2145342.1 PH domain-containing protein [Pedobacter planticolens]